MNRRPAPLKQRLEEKIIISEQGCWEWTGHIMKNGYGQTSINKKVLLAHRASYMVYKGDIPEGLLVCHTCDNRKCINPDHLFLGTYKDNYEDCVTKGRTNRLYGVDSPHAKLSEEDVLDIRNRYERGKNTSKLAAEYGISPSYVLQLVKYEWRKNG